MTQTKFIVKLARMGRKWTTVAEVKEWRYVSAVETDGGEVTEYEHSAERSDALPMSRFAAQDVAKACRDRFFGVVEAVTVETPAQALGNFALPTPQAQASLLHMGNLPEAPRRVKDCRSAKFCKVYMPKRRSVVLQNIAASNRIVRGITLDGTPTTIILRKGMRVEPLAASCDGRLVPLKDACHCTRTMALAVEHSAVWGGR